MATGSVAGDWAPDGNRIAFLRISGEAGRFSSLLFSIAPEGGEAKELARFDGLLADAPRYSPDGRTIVLAVQPISNASGWFELVGLDGRSRRLMPPHSLGGVSSAVFSRDAGSLLYAQQLLVR